MGHWSTYPVVLAPCFGQMIAEQIFRMWSGMRRSGTLAAEEPFPIAEFGAGNGSLAESILDYIGQQSKTASDKRWRDSGGKRFMPATIDRPPSVRRSASEMPASEDGLRRALETRPTPPP
ncbi:MAG: SAM-dependent methyltransferase [Bryobacteraceae bacterium]